MPKKSSKKLQKILSSTLPLISGRFDCFNEKFVLGKVHLARRSTLRAKLSRVSLSNCITVYENDQREMIQTLLDFGNKTSRQMGLGHAFSKLDERFKNWILT